MTIRTWWSLRRTSIIRRIRRWLICFPSNLHVTGFSSCRITTMIHSNLVWFLWWLRHGAIGPSEATLFGVNVDWPECRIHTFWCGNSIKYSETAGLTVLHHFCNVPLVLWSQGSSPKCLSIRVKPCRTSETSFFAATFAVTLHHFMTQEPGRHTTCRCGVFSFWFSGEVKHIVHLIRWNLKAVYANWGKTWPRSRQGNNARPLGFLGTESCLTILLFPFFHQLAPIGP